MTFLALATIPWSLYASEPTTAKLEAVVTTEALVALLARIPEKIELGDGAVSVSPKKLLQIPAGLEELGASRRYLDETPSAYRARMKDSAANVCRVLPLIRTASEKLSRVNEGLGKAADVCEDVTGSRVCLRLQDSPIATSDSAAKELASGRIAIAIFAPAQFRVLAEGSFDALGRKVAPVLSPETVSCREIQLPITPEIDLGSFYVCWNKATLEEALEQSQKALVARADSLVDALTQQRSRMAAASGKKEPAARFAQTMAIRQTDLVLRGAARLALARTYATLRRDVFCASEPPAALATKLHRPAPSAESLSVTTGPERHDRR